MTIKDIQDYFKEAGFDIQKKLPEGFLAKKKGKHFKLLSYTDYYFVKFSDDISITTIDNIHKNSIIEANKDYKLPKYLRLSVPNINTVFIVENNISDEVISYAKQRSQNIVGGQQDSVFILSTLNYEMYAAGKEFSYISGEAKLIWGNQKEFRTINGHNRSYYFMTKLFQKLIG